MINFWENIFRYPRFFITAMIGLISIIIGPFIYVLKKSSNKFWIILILLVVMSILIFTLKTMIDY